MMEEMDLLSPDEELLFPAMHPLYNSVVLASLFKKHCPGEDLPKCRLVCKQWHRHSLDNWRATRTLHLDYSKSFYATTPNSNSDSLKQFLNFLEDPSNECIALPYRKLHLTTWQFQLEQNGMFHDPWIERLCWGPILGPHITTLNLSRCHFGGVKEFQLIIYRFCPALQSLTLDRNNCDEQKGLGEPMRYQEPEYGEQTNLKSITISEISQGLPVSWLELLSHFPFLQSVGIKNVRFADSNVIEVLDALKVVKMKMNDADILPITDFDVTPYISISGDGSSLRTCAILQEYKIPIKRVYLKMDGGLSRELVQNFVALQANSLIAINVSKSQNVEWPFPLGMNLNKLETLAIRSPTDPFGDMEFLKYIPNLTSLSLVTGSTGLMGHHPRHPLTQMVSNTLETEEMANLQLLKLTGLKIAFTLGEEDVRKLVKWLPNIQKLEMVLDDTLFPVICQHWTNLESIVVYGRELTDTGVIGRPVDNPGEEVEVQPNVTCLEKLIYFGAKNCENITEASVLQGFLKTKNLKRLMLHTVTKRSKIALRGKGIFLDRNFMLGQFFGQDD